MATPADFLSNVGVVGAVAPKAGGRHRLDQTRISSFRQPRRFGRRRIGDVSSWRVHAEERPENSLLSRPAPRKEVPDLHSANVKKIDPPKRLSADDISYTEPVEDHSVDFGKTLGKALQSYLDEVTTGCAQILKDPSPARAFGKILSKEGKMVYIMMCNDVSSALLPFICMGANLLTVSPFLQTGDYRNFLIEAATTMSKEVAYSFFYLYAFNLANQYLGADADVIDKPWRPIPSGLVSREGVLARYVLASLLYSFVSWQLGVLQWTLLWQALTAAQFRWLNKDKSTRGLGRSFAMFAGTFTMCGAGVSLATTMTPTLLLWSLTRSAVSGNHHWMQDFRDIDGDKRVGKTTFPLMFGVENARKLLAFIFFMEPIFLHYVVMKDTSYSTMQLILEGLGLGFYAVLIYRVLYCTTPKEDHDTYTWWLTTFSHNWNFLLVGPAFLMGL